MKWVDVASVVVKDLYEMSETKENNCINKLEFLIHYADRVGERDIDRVIEEI